MRKIFLLEELHGIGWGRTGRRRGVGWGAQQSAAYRQATQNDLCPDTAAISNASCILFIEWKSPHKMLRSGEKKKNKVRKRKQNKTHLLQLHLDLNAVVVVDRETRQDHGKWHHHAVLEAAIDATLAEIIQSGPLLPLSLDIFLRRIYHKLVSEDNTTEQRAKLSRLVLDGRVSRIFPDSVISYSLCKYILCKTVPFGTQFYFS